MLTKTIIITGASSGIGRALAEHLAEIGNDVIATGRDKEALEILQQKFPTRIETVVADLNNEADWHKIPAAVDEKTSGLFFVHSAGVAKPQLLSSLTAEHWDKHYLVNTKSVIFLSQLLLPKLKNGGRVLNVSTSLAHGPMLAMAPYGVTKAATYMWKEYANLEFNKDGVHFGSIKPGVVDTPIQQNLRSYDGNQFPAVDVFKGFAQRNELISPAVVAKFIAWILFETKNDDFIRGEWDIYDESHQPNWAAKGDVNQRKRS